MIWRTYAKPFQDLKRHHPYFLLLKSVIEIIYHEYKKDKIRQSKNFFSCVQSQIPGIRKIPRPRPLEFWPRTGGCIISLLFQSFISKNNTQYRPVRTLEAQQQMRILSSQFCIERFRKFRTIVLASRALAVRKADLFVNKIINAFFCLHFTKPFYTGL